MSAATYENLLDQVQRLSPADQVRLLEELAGLVRRQVAVPAKRSILELQGLGKAIWQDVDAQRHVDRERASWNG